jgi:hypothetical protein
VAATTNAFQHTLCGHTGVGYFLVEYLYDQGGHKWPPGALTYLSKVESWIGRLMSSSIQNKVAG